MNEKDKREFNRKLKRDVTTIIKRHGWQITGVGADKHNPSFAYTTGLTNYELPELIVVGLPMQTAKIFLNRFGTEMADGKKFELNKPYFGYSSNDDYPSAFIEVSEESKAEYMTLTYKFYNQFEAWQFIWCDTRGNLPWHECYDSQFHIKQSILGDSNG